MRARTKGRKRENEKSVRSETERKGELMGKLIKLLGLTQPVKVNSMSPSSQLNDFKKI